MRQAAPGRAGDGKGLIGPDRRSRLPLAAGGVLGLVAGAVLGGAAYVAQQLTAVPPASDIGHFGFTPWELGVEYEEVAFPAADGAMLRGWLLLRPGVDRVIVGLGGYRSRRPDLLGIGSRLWHAGYNVLLFDYRGHGESDGRRVTLGYTETSDFRAALAWLRSRLPGAWIGAIGYSMGGAVAILGAADEPTVRAVVADCAFASQEAVIRREWRRRLWLPSSPVIEVTDRLLPLLHGFRFRDVEPLAVVDRLAPRSLLLIHAEADRVVPVEHAHRLYAAAGEPKQLWLIPNTPHCGGYFADRIGYCRRVAAFFDHAADLTP